MESYTDILQVREKSGCRLETISFPTIVTKAGSRRRGMCCVVFDRERHKMCSKFCQCSECVCARTALTDSSSDKHQL